MVSANGNAGCNCGLAREAKSRNAGVYSLFVRVAKRKTISIGRLGPVTFERGVYVYVGSALNSLEGRVSRHFRVAKRKHWHVDYLLCALGVSLVGAASRHTMRRLECSMSRAVQKRAFSSVEGFGCSDCNCRSHLHYLGSMEKASSFIRVVGFHKSQSRNLVTS